MGVGAGVSRGHSEAGGAPLTGRTGSAWQLAQYDCWWHRVHAWAPIRRTTAAWLKTISSCGTWTAGVEWQFSQYVRVWHAPHEVFDGSRVVTTDLWPKIQSLSRWLSGRWPMRIAEV